MFAWDIGWWWCCLNPRERSVLHSTIEALSLTVWVGIPVSLWDSFWLIQTGVSPRVKEAFRYTYKLEIVTIVLEGEEVAVIRPVGGYLLDWASWLAFILTPDAACVGGCGQSQLP